MIKDSGRGVWAYILRSLYSSRSQKLFYGVRIWIWLVKTSALKSARWNISGNQRKRDSAGTSLKC